MNKQDLLREVVVKYIDYFYPVWVPNDYFFYTLLSPVRDPACSRRPLHAALQLLFHLSVAQDSSNIVVQWSRRFSRLITEPVSRWRSPNVLVAIAVRQQRFGDVSATAVELSISALSSGLPYRSASSNRDTLSINFSCTLENLSICYIIKIICSADRVR